MSELTIGQLVKIILGIIVFVVVVGGVYFFFKDYVIGFFNNYGNEPTKIVLGILR